MKITEKQIINWLRFCDYPTSFSEPDAIITDKDMSQATIAMIYKLQEDKEAYKTELYKSRSVSMELAFDTGEHESWKKLCIAAVKFLRASPHDPDIFNHQRHLWTEYKKLLETVNIEQELKK